MITLKNICKYRPRGDGSAEGLHSVDLCVERGEFVTIAGPSGSGKSTLLAILGLIEKPSSGSYTLGGREVAGLGDRELSRLRGRHFGFLFGGSHLIPELDAVENVMLPMAYACMPKALRRTRAIELLERLGLGLPFERLPVALTTLERQRVAIARSLANDPAFLLADEPTARLRSEEACAIVQVLSALHREGLAIVLATHDETLGALGERRLRILDGLLEKALPDISRSA